MNYLVFLDPQAGELEKILSGTKSMILRKINPALPAAESVAPGNSLYFLKNNGDCTLRVRATVVRVLPSLNSLGEDLSRTLKVSLSLIDQNKPLVNANRLLVSLIGS
jgi:hypothetical protein